MNTTLAQLIDKAHRCLGDAKKQETNVSPWYIVSCLHLVVLLLIHIAIQLDKNKENQ